MSKVRSTLIVLAGAAALAPTAHAASHPLAVKAVSLVTAPEVGPDVVAVFFRTDGALARKANGKSLDASVVLAGGVASVATVRESARHCYVSYTKRGSLQLGKGYVVKVRLGDRAHTRTATLKRGGASTMRGAQIGC